MNEKALKARELKGEDLNSFIEAKGISTICFLCGNDGVMIMSHGPDKPLQLFAMPLVHPDAEPGDTAETAGFICSNCGHVTTFAASLIVEWKYGEPPNDG
ncbi:hypothetical protein [Vreelandella piezotolerans]|uniref:hypothetical protein n=1 Tax=Vreelandella piezotolerans TaxID=2609667 RepID=UPI0037906D7F